MSEQIAASKITAQTVYQGNVLLKLILFSLALAIFPLSSYFLSEKYLWNGNSTYAAITAIVTANVVLVGYIIVSLMEERQAGAAVPPSKEAAPSPESKKTQ